MRVFLAGAAGAIGRQLTPLLVEAGHDVVGTTRSAERAAWLRSIGARAAVVDVLDAAALRAAVMQAAPTVVIHQLTDLAAGFSPVELAATERLRALGTRHVVEAASGAGSRRLIAQSAAWLYADGPEPHDEGHPLKTPTCASEHATLRGILALEQLVRDVQTLDGVLLRYGYFYGPGTAAEADDTPEPRVSVVAAARAALLAVDHGPAGAFNVVDDNDQISNRRARELLGWSP